MLIEILSNIGLLSLAAVTVFLIVTRTGIALTDHRGQVIIGLIFGLIAVLVVKVPVTIPQGATFDTRVGPILLAGVHGGPLAALIAATIGAIARYNVGGPAWVGGVLSFFVYALTSQAARWWFRRHAREYLRPVDLTALALVATVSVLPCFFISVPPATALAILQKAWYVLLIGNISGTLLLGLLVGEMQHISRERERFRQASIQANAGLEAKSRFISAISHDIRTPLNGILGVFQLLAHSTLSERDQAHIRMAHQAGRYLLDLVNQVLEFSRLEAGFESDPNATFTPAQLLDEMQSIFTPLANEKGLRLATLINRHEQTMLRGDYAHLRQVLFNLVSNAVRYTYEGSVIVRINVADTPDGQLHIGFTVEDSGPGIAPADQARIFEEFVRIENPSSDQSGSGLGLAIAQTIVRNMGGELQLHSEVGRGSSFSFTLSFCRAPEGATLPHSVTPTQGRPLRLLAVDDNALNRLLLEEGLKRFGHSVQTLASGSAAIATLKAHPADFDAVLMDVVMPELHGDEATRIIRDTLPGTPLPIIALTANALPEQRERYLAAGMNSVFTKPIDFDNLNQHLTALLGDDTLTPPVTTATSSDAPVSEDLLDIAHIQSLTANLRTERLQEMAQDALTLIEELLGKLEDPATSMPEQHDLAHQIKGLAANFGLARLSQLAAEIQQLCEADTDPEATIQQLCQTFAPSSAAIRATLSHAG